VDDAGRQGPVAHGTGHPVGGPRADVPGGKDAGTESFIGVTARGPQSGHLDRRSLAGGAGAVPARWS
jgi:hypothetical protein